VKPHQDRDISRLCLGKVKAGRLIVEQITGYRHFLVFPRSLVYTTPST